ncbi:hypothetical protein Mgra_00003884, partial [Meloidogyne graminicola]
NIFLLISFLFIISIINLNNNNNNGGVLADVLSRTFKHACFGLWRLEECNRTCKREGYRSGHCSLRVQCWCKR